MAEALMGILKRLGISLAYIPVFWTVAALAMIVGFNIGAKNGHLFWESFAVLAMNLLGYIFGATATGLSKEKYGLKCGLSETQIKELSGEADTRESSFILFISLLSTVYAVGYYFTLKSFVNSIQDVKPLNEGVVAVTCITMFVMAYFTMRYAAYVKVTKLLETAIAQKREDDAVKILKDSVFRDEQLLEPPGNIFVTIGITATFLGMGLGLIMLDPVGLLDATRETINSQEQVTNRATVTSSLRSFLGCMGLALGMSMLGVITAMAAQWLRGFGAATSTEILLSDADAALLSGAEEPPPDSAKKALPAGRRQPGRARAGVGKDGPPPSKRQNHRKAN